MSGPARPCDSPPCTSLKPVRRGAGRDRPISDGGQRRLEGWCPCRKKRMTGSGPGKTTRSQRRTGRLQQRGAGPRPPTKRASWGRGLPLGKTDYTSSFFGHPADLISDQKSRIARRVEAFFAAVFLLVGLPSAMLGIMTASRGMPGTMGVSTCKQRWRV